MSSLLRSKIQTGPHKGRSTPAHTHTKKISNQNLLKKTNQSTFVLPKLVSKVDLFDFILKLHSNISLPVKQVKQNKTRHN